MSNKEEDNNLTNKSEVKSEVKSESIAEREKSLDLFGDIWGDDEDNNSDEESMIDNEFNDLSLEGNKKDTKLDNFDLDSAFDQVISHYEMSSAEKKRLEDIKKNEAEAKIKQEKIMKNKNEAEAKRNKELEDRKKKREKKNKKFNYKRSSGTQSKMTQYTDKYDKYQDDYYDY